MRKNKRISLNGLDILNQTSFNEIKPAIMDLIAKSSIWVECEKVQPGPIFPEVKRGRSKDKGKIINGIRIDDNTYANRALKEAISKGVKFEDFEVCHIWPGTTYDERYHTLLQNLVLIPRVLAGLSDHMEEAIAMLKFRSWELYGWHPENQEIPQKPDYYPKEWGTLVPNLTTEYGEDLASPEDYIKELDYEEDKEANEVDKVKRKVPEWIKKPNQINSTILKTFMKMSKNGKLHITREQLQESALNNGIKDFMGNYNQMKNFGIKNHAKVFTELKDGTVKLWEPIGDFVKDLYENN